MPLEACQTHPSVKCGWFWQVSYAKICMRHFVLEVRRNVLVSASIMLTLWDANTGIVNTDFNDS